MRNLIHASLVFFAIVGTAQAQDRRTLKEIEKAYRHGILKVSAFSSKSIIQGGKNICANEGTGFVISRRHLITAWHVLQLDRRCGDIFILVRSKMHNVEFVANLVDKNTLDDVALIAVEQDIPSQICSLVMRPEDVFDDVGYRMGIPGPNENPRLMAVNIGMKGDEFPPFVKVEPYDAEKGESGGPVFVGYSVVGVMHAQHKTVSNLSVMSRGEPARKLIEAAKIEKRRDDCNVAHPTWTSTSSQNVSNAAGSVVIASVIVKPPRPTPPSTVNVIKLNVVTPFEVAPDLLNKAHQKTLASTPPPSALSVTANLSSVQISGPVEAASAYAEIYKQRFDAVLKSELETIVRLELKDLQRVEAGARPPNSSIH